MKTIKNIAKVFIGKLNNKPNNIYKDNNSKYWKTYISITGFEGNNQTDYYDIYFSESSNKKVIQITKTTDNPKKYLKILKEIEPDQPVVYSEKIITTKEIVI